MVDKLPTEPVEVPDVSPMPYKRAKPPPVETSWREMFGRVAGPIGTLLLVAMLAGVVLVVTLLALWSPTSSTELQRQIDEVSVRHTRDMTRTTQIVRDIMLREQAALDKLYDYAAAQASKGIEVRYVRDLSKGAPIDRRLGLLEAEVERLEEHVEKLEARASRLEDRHFLQRKDPPK